MHFPKNGHKRRIGKYWQSVEIDKKTIETIKAQHNENKNIALISNEKLKYYV